MKDLSEMTNEELWQLFPVIISDHNPQWISLYREEEKLLLHIIGKENVSRISHIGSTAVPSLVAKPTIDILVEIAPDTDIERLTAKMTEKGFIYSPQPQKPPPHMLFMKGYTTEGFKGQAFHVHIRYEGDWDELYFRDYLISHPDRAREYGKLKLALKQTYEHDRDKYTAAKTNFICETVKLARQDNRYE